MIGLILISVHAEKGNNSDRELATENYMNDSITQQCVDEES